MAGSRKYCNEFGSLVDNFRKESVILKSIARKLLQKQ
jgi:hypothetical protein